MIFKIFFMYLLGICVYEPYLCNNYTVLSLSYLMLLTSVHDSRRFLAGYFCASKVAVPALAKQFWISCLAFCSWDGFSFVALFGLRFMGLLLQPPWYSENLLNLCMALFLNFKLLWHWIILWLLLLNYILLIFVIIWVSLLLDHYKIFSV